MIWLTTDYADSLGPSRSMLLPAGVCQERGAEGESDKVRLGLGLGLAEEQRGRVIK